MGQGWKAIIDETKGRRARRERERVEGERRGIAYIPKRHIRTEEWLDVRQQNCRWMRDEARAIYHGPVSKQRESYACGRQRFFLCLRSSTSDSRMNTAADSATLALYSHKSSKAAVHMRSFYAILTFLSGWLSFFFFSTLSSSYITA